MTRIKPSDQCHPRREAANDNDRYAMCDTDSAPPNRHAQWRGHQAVLVLVLLAGVVALIAGASEGSQEAFSAFPNAHALLQAAAWGRFFDAVGQVGTIGLILIGAALVLRWLLRRRRA